MGFLFTVGALAALGIIAMRYGADSRDGAPGGWLPRRRGPRGRRDSSVANCSS